MDLVEHLRVIAALHRGVSQEGSITPVEDAEEMAREMEEAKRTGYYDILATTLSMLVCAEYEVYRDEAIPALRALVGHVLKECPGARGKFLDDIVHMCPELAPEFA